MFLLQNGILDSDLINRIRDDFRKEIEQAIEVVEKPILADSAKELRDMYAALPETTAPEATVVPLQSGSGKRMIDAVRDGLWQSMD